MCANEYEQNGSEELVELLHDEEERFVTPLPVHDPVVGRQIEDAGTVADVLGDQLDPPRHQLGERHKEGDDQHLAHLLGVKHRIHHTIFDRSHRQEQGTIQKVVDESLRKQQIVQVGIFQ